MDRDEEVLVLKHYNKIPTWIEWLVYVSVLSLFVGYVLTLSVYPVVVITAALLYWNYKLFGILNNYISYINATGVIQLLTELYSYHDNEQKDGTFQDTDGLIKGEDSDETEER